MTRSADSRHLRLVTPESGVTLAAAPASRPAPCAEGPDELGIVVHERLGTSSLASTHFGWQAREGRVVVVKRIHDHLREDGTLTRTLLEESRLATHVVHPNVVRTIGVVDRADAVAVATDYVPGSSLAEVLDAVRPGRLAPALAASVAAGVLRGLHAAHSTRGADGRLLGIVHRDVSAENMLLGADGVVRVLGFGVARAAWRRPSARPDSVRARLPYASPEELTDRQIDEKSDVYAASVVLWEMLAGRRLFDDHSVEATLESVLRAPVRPPSAYGFDVSPALDAIVLRGLARDTSLRYASAEHMAIELEGQPAFASTAELARFVVSLDLPKLSARNAIASSIAEREASICTVL